MVVVALLPASPPVLAHGDEAHPYDGAWYDPSHDGEGWIVEILPDDTAVVYWFTYPPEGSGEAQAWIQGVGQVSDSTLEITESVITRGPRFGPDYDRDELEAESWGTWIMTFSDCDSGTVTYDGPQAFGDGEFQIQRLTALEGSACAQAAKSEDHAVGFSGSWYEPASDGQGITLEVLPDGSALIYWFTYAPDGSQAWVLAVGTAEGDRFEFPEVLMPVGTVFGPNFDPDAVETVPWGSLSLTFDTCGNAAMYYRSELDGWGHGWLPMQRLTHLGNHPCEVEPGPPLSRGSWARSIEMLPPVSEVGTAVLNGRAYSAGDFGNHGRAFIEFNPQMGRTRTLADLPSFRHHAMMAAHGDYLYLIGGYSPQAVDDVLRYDPATDQWRNYAATPGPVAASAAITLGDYIYVLTKTGTVWRFEPDSKDWTVYLGPDTVHRDHGNAVAFRGEIWWMAGRLGTEAYNSVDIFDPVTRVWRPGPPLQYATSGYAAAVVQGQIMVAGGEYPAPFNTPWSLIPILEVYSPRVGSWFRGPDIPFPVHGVGGVSLNGRFYLMGGSVTAGIADNPGIIQQYVPGS